jgi:hypothetical protein
MPGRLRKFLRTAAARRGASPGAGGVPQRGGRETYHVSIAEGRGFCSCPDSQFRHTVCKHAALLALAAIRHPDTAPKAPGVPDLHLAKAKPNWTFAA